MRAERVRNGPSARTHLGWCIQRELASGPTSGHMPDLDQSTRFFVELGGDSSTWRSAGRNRNRNRTKFETIVR